LRQAARYHRDGSHHALLVALRELHDPTLKPLFQSLVQAEYWSMQVDGVFGLAELDPRGVLDPFLLSQVKSPTDRSTAIAAAVQLEMVDKEQAAAILTWSDLTPRDRTLLYAEISRRGGEFDSASVRALLDTSDTEVLGIAGLLLAAHGDKTALALVSNHLSQLAPRERATALIGLSAAATTFSVTSAVPLLDAALKDTALAPEARVACIAALLALDQERGLAAWRAALEASTSQSLRVRLALVLLASEKPLPQNVGDPLRAVATQSSVPNDPLLGKLADALDGVAAGDASSALAALVATQHRPSMATALAVTRRADDRTRRATYEAFLQIFSRNDRLSLAPGTIDLCVDAASRLAALDPAAIGKRLEAAVEDQALHDLFLLALFGAGTKEASAIAYAARDRSSPRSAAMSLLLHARYAATLTTSELDQLGVIAAGGSPLDQSMQVQAAWLYARHSGKADQAIALALAPAAVADGSAPAGTVAETPVRVPPPLPSDRPSPDSPRTPDRKPDPTPPPGTRRP